MDPRHLNPDELEFEMALRQINISDADQAIVRLQQMLNAEASCAAADPADVQRLTRKTVKRELSECDAKLRQITEELDVAVRDANDAMAERGQSRLAHITARIRRLQGFAPGHAAVERLQTRAFEMRHQVARARESFGSGEELVGAQGFALEAAVQQQAIGGAIPKSDRTSDGNAPQLQLAAMLPNPLLETPLWQLPALQQQQQQHQQATSQPLQRQLQRSPVAAPAPPACQQPRQEHAPPLQAAQLQQTLPAPSQPSLASATFQQQLSQSMAEMFAMPPPERNFQFDGPRGGFNSAMVGNRPAVAAQPPASQQPRSLPQPLPAVTQQRLVAPAAHVQASAPVAAPGAAAPIDQRSSFSQQASQGLAGGHSIHKWKLRFDGGPNSLDAEDFIFRVERQAQLYGVTLRALTIGFGELLTDRAAQWYWTFQRHAADTTWEEMKQAFFRRYAPHRDTDYEIRSKIESRKQKPGELFNDFCQDVEALAVRLIRRMPQEELLEVLKRNMLTQMRRALWRVTTRTVDELLQSCCEYERLFPEDVGLRKPARVAEMRNTEQYVPQTQQYQQATPYLEPPRTYQSQPQQQQHQSFVQQSQYQSVMHQPQQQAYALHPQYQAAPQQPQYQAAAQQPSYQAGESVDRYGEYADQQQGASQEQFRAYDSDAQQAWCVDGVPSEYVEAVNVPQKRGEHAICWNCYDIGHVFAQCPKPQQAVFCFTCGLKGAITITCPKCSLNLHRDKPSAGLARPAQNQQPQLLRRPIQQTQQMQSQVPRQHQQIAQQVQQQRPQPMAQQLQQPRQQQRAQTQQQVAAVDNPFRMPNQQQPN